MTPTQTAVPLSTSIPGYLTGTWDIDPVHSEISFSVRHLMVSKVRGRFSDFSGSFVTADDPRQSSVEAEIALASIDTNAADRDAHLRSPDFFDVEHFPVMVYRSTGVRPDGDGYVVEGELTLKGVTRSVPLRLEVHGFLPQSPFGDARVGFTATGEIARDDFGMTFNIPVDGGGIVVGNLVQITLEIEAIRRSS